MQKWQAVESNGEAGVFTFKTMAYIKRPSVYPNRSLFASNLTAHLETVETDASLNGQKFKVIENSDGTVFLRSELDTMYYVSVKADTQPERTEIFLDTDTTVKKTNWKLTKVE